MNWFALGWRGFLMGVVEVLPGISGGTIALLTRVYERLVDALSTIQNLPIRTEHRGQWRAAFAFLFRLGIGMVCGFLLTMFVVLDLVDRHPLLLWGLIFGVVVGAAIVLIRANTRYYLLRFVPVGLLIGVPIVAIPSLTAEPPLWLYLVGGVSAFSAWLLPGISGSMVLLLLGLWLPTLEAINNLEFAKLGLLLAGVVVAFLAVPRLLKAAIQRYREAMQGIFVGLVISTLYRVWPWRTDSGAPDIGGIGIDLGQTFVLGLCVLVGSACVLLPTLWSERNAS